jgi:hypothetical protein
MYFALGFGDARVHLVTMAIAWHVSPPSFVRNFYLVPSTYLMNARIAFIAVILTVTLAVAALFLLRPPSATSTGATTPSQPSHPILAALAGLDRERVIGLTTTSPASSFGFYTDSELDAPLARPQDGPLWPIDPSRTAAAMRLLAQSAGEAVPQTAGFTGATRINITLARNPDAPLTFDISPPQLGGRAAIAAGDQYFTFPARTASLFEPRAVEVWRAALVFPLLNVGEPVTIISAAQMMNVTLQSGESSQWMVKDLSVPADPAAIENLLRSLSALPAVRLIGHPQESMIPGKTRSTMIPTFTLEVTSLLRRTGRADISKGSAQNITKSTLAYKLAVFAAADAAGTTVQAVAEGILTSPGQPPRTVYGPMLLTLPRTAIEAISPDRFSYVSPAPLPLPPADITTLRIRTIPPGIELSAPGALAAPLDDPSWPLILSRNPDGSWATRGHRALGLLPADRVAPLLTSLTKGPVKQAEGSKAGTQSLPVTDTAPDLNATAERYMIAAETSRGQVTLAIALPEAKDLHSVVRRGGLYYFYTNRPAADPDNPGNAAIIPLHALLAELLPGEG